MLLEWKIGIISSYFLINLQRYKELIYPTLVVYKKCESLSLCVGSHVVDCVRSCGINLQNSDNSYATFRQIVKLFHILVW